MSFFVLGQYRFGAFVLFGDYFLGFGIDEFGRFFAVWFGETVVGLSGRIVITHIGQFVAHAEIGHHGVCFFCGAFEVVDGACVERVEE